mmetsp:Transcript_3360/g.12194  ORF Transcript_3360/g.12194 Transcript_3360/m.12194 type:complete len:240 (+) Transcript_3360:1663-2382(+)
MCGLVRGSQHNTDAGPLLGVAVPEHTGGWRRVQGVQPRDFRRVSAHRWDSDCQAVWGARHIQRRCVAAVVFNVEQRDVDCARERCAHATLDVVGAAHIKRVPNGAKLDHVGGTADESVDATRREHDVHRLGRVRICEANGPKPVRSIASHGKHHRSRVQHHRLYTGCQVDSKATGQRVEERRGRRRQATCVDTRRFVDHVIRRPHQHPGNPVQQGASSGDAKRVEAASGVDAGAGHRHR